MITRALQAATRFTNRKTPDSRRRLPRQTNPDRHSVQLVGR
jgi:hypothetical protein